MLRHILAKPRCKEARKRRFRHYTSHFGAIFHPKTGLGSKFPWDGSAIPWDGNRNPWDVSAEQPHGRTKISLKGGRRWASALTVCHIAHTQRGTYAARPRPMFSRRGAAKKMRRGAFSFRPFLLPFGQKPTRMKLSSLLLCAALLTGAAPLPAGATDGHVCFGTPRPEAAGRALLQGKRRQRATEKSIFFVIFHPKHLSTT